MSHRSHPSLACTSVSSCCGVQPGPAFFLKRSHREFTVMPKGAVKQRQRSFDSSDDP